MRNLCSLLAVAICLLSVTISIVELAVIYAKIKNYNTIEVQKGTCIVWVPLDAAACATDLCHMTSPWKHIMRICINCITKFQRYSL